MVILSAGSGAKAALVMLCSKASGAIELFPLPSSLSDLRLSDFLLLYLVTLLLLTSVIF